MEASYVKSIDELKQRVIETRDAYHKARWALKDAQQNALAIRVCRLCKKQIKVAHKWHFVTIKGVTMTEHRHCDNPYSYRAAKP